MLSLKSYRLLAYLGLIPFLVFTYQTWCGPIEQVLATTATFLVFSTSTLIFISGCWWGVSYSQAHEIKLPMMLVAIIFALGGALALAFMPHKWAIISMGIAHFLIWILEFFMLGLMLDHSYKIQRTILTMTIVVCHALVSIQFF